MYIVCRVCVLCERERARVCVCELCIVMNTVHCTENKCLKTLSPFSHLLYFNDDYYNSLLFLFYSIYFIQMAGFFIRNTKKLLLRCGSVMWLSIIIVTTAQISMLERINNIHYMNLAINIIFMAFWHSGAHFCYEIWLHYKIIWLLEIRSCCNKTKMPTIVSH